MGTRRERTRSQDNAGSWVGNKTSLQTLGLKKRRSLLLEPGDKEECVKRAADRSGNLKSIDQSMLIL